MFRITVELPAILIENPYDFPESLSKKLLDSILK